MRICLLTPYHASWTKQEVSILEELGHVVFPIYFLEYGRAQRFPYVPVVSSLYGFSRMFIKSVPSCLKSDLIYCWFVFPSGVFGVMLGRFLRKKVVLNAVGCDVAYVPSINYGDPGVCFFRPFISWALKNATKVVAVSKESAFWATWWGGRDVEVIYEGIDTDKFQPRNVDRDKEKNGRHLLLTVSSLEWGQVVRKDFNTLFKALSKVITAYPDVKLRIVGGKGGAYPTLKKLARDLKIENNVVFEGLVPLSRLKDLYNQCDIFVLPSLHEGFPTVCAEAQACEKPVVSTNVASMPEVIENMKSGILVSPRDPEELADAIIKLLENKEIRAKMGKFGREVIANNFSRDVRKAKLSRMLESVAAPGHKL